VGLQEGLEGTEIPRGEAVAGVGLLLAAEGVGSQGRRPAPVLKEVEEVADEGLLAATLEELDVGVLPPRGQIKVGIPEDHADEDVFEVGR